MNQLYTEYLIDFAVKERLDQAARWDKMREAQSARTERSSFVRILTTFRMPRTRRRHSVTGLAAVNHSKRATA